MRATASNGYSGVTFESPEEGRYRMNAYGDTSFPEHHAAYRLDGSGGCVSTARGCTRAYLEQCAPFLPQDATGNALVLVSELVTNAVLHAPGPCCLYLVEADAELTIAVSDTSTVPPRPRIPDLSRGGGFGWHILRRLARRVDVYVRPPWGKTVCATIRLPGQAAC
jgi:anti-sigma regulatory factor (Ser/Thr protein kinase)